MDVGPFGIEVLILALTQYPWQPGLAMIGLSGTFLIGFYAILNLPQTNEDDQLRQIQAPSLDSNCGIETSEQGPMDTPQPVKQSAEDLFALQSFQRQDTFRLLFCAAGIPGLLILMTVLGIEEFGMTPLLRRTVATTQTSTGLQFLAGQSTSFEVSGKPPKPHDPAIPKYKLTFDSARGGLLHGELTLKNVKFVGEQPAGLNFSLSCATVRVRCSCWSLFRNPPVIDELLLTGIRGSCVQQPAATKPLQGKVVVPPPPLPIQPGKQQSTSQIRVDIRHLRIIDSQVRFIDQSVEGEPVKFDFNLKSLYCQAFRTDRAPFDILFRSQIEGQLDDGPFHVIASDTAEGEQTEWNASKLPVKLVRAYFGGPFRWLSEGTFDVRATQLVRVDPTRPVELDCQLIVNDGRAEVPEGLKPAIAIGAQFLVSYLNQRTEPIDLGFKLELDRKRFDLRTTESLTQLWTQIRTSAVSSLVKLTGQKFDIIVDLSGAQNTDEAIDQAADLAGQLLERIQQRRKAKREAKRK